MDKLAHYVVVVTEVFAEIAAEVATEITTEITTEISAEIITEVLTELKAQVKIRQPKELVKVTNGLGYRLQIWLIMPVI